MHQLRKNGELASTPSRRHFFGIAAAAARKVSLVSMGVGAWTMSGRRRADAREHHDSRHHAYEHEHHVSHHWSSPSREQNTWSNSPSVSVRCLMAGTPVRTAQGEVPVENLLPGMEVWTLNGPKPVKWLGRQNLNRDRSVAWHPKAWPVRVSQFAIDEQTPRCDVYLSQNHALFIDGVLIPVRNLVNGRSIRFEEPGVATLDYFSVELDTHNVIYAADLPVETFRYSGGPIAWDNLDEYGARYGAHEFMDEFAPVHSYEGGFDHVRGLVRLAASYVKDVRDPIQCAYDRLAKRALMLAA